MTAVTHHASLQLKQTLEGILKAPLDTTAWTQARLPVRSGRLGVRDPELLHCTSRLGSLVSVQQEATALGADQTYIKQQMDSAKLR